MPVIPARNQAIVFDLDDTLYAERDYVLSGYRAICEHLSDDPSHSDRMRDWLWERFLSGRTAGAFDALNENFSLGLTGPQITELVAVYRDHSPQITPRPGVCELLTRLHVSNLLGIVSDGFLPAQELKLDALGLAEHFDAVVFTEAMGREAWKPSPAGFEAICRELQIDAGQCTYVGDNPSKDFAAPNGLGWRTVQLLLDGQVHSHKPAPPGGEAQLIANSLEELDGMIA
ncbi:MAG: HAD family hydrolase [Phycisphaerae bacterium]|jgi:putative hydrolase of the HAD superfamily|nr:HAD family hydrolase [Phycisphaerae bacterium]